MTPLYEAASLAAMTLLWLSIAAGLGWIAFVLSAGWRDRRRYTPFQRRVRRWDARYWDAKHGGGRRA